jgi:hypothetical protein
VRGGVARWKRGQQSHGVEQAVNYAFSGACDATLTAKTADGVIAAVGYADAVMTRYIVENGAIRDDLLTPVQLKDWVDGLNPLSRERRGRDLESPVADLILDATINAPKSFSIAAMLVDGGGAVGIATPNRSRGWLTLLLNVGVPALVCGVVCLIVPGSWADRVILTAEVLTVVALAGLAAILAMWPTAHDGWGRQVDLVQQVVTTCFAFVVPATVVTVLTPRIAPIVFDDRVPLSARMIGTAPLTLAVAACVLIALSAVVPWHRTVFRALSPWTLWGLASAFGKWSVEKSLNSLKSDLGAARQLRADAEAEPA